MVDPDLPSDERPTVRARLYCLKRCSSFPTESYKLAYDLHFASQSNSIELVLSSYLLPQQIRKVCQDDQADTYKLVYGGNCVKLFTYQSLKLQLLSPKNQEGVSPQSVLSIYLDRMN